MEHNAKRLSVSIAKPPEIPGSGSLYICEAAL